MILAAALFIWVWLFVLNAFCTESPYQPVSALSEPELFPFMSSRFFYRPLSLTGAVSRITESSNHLSPGHCAQWRGTAVGWGWGDGVSQLIAGISEKQDSLLIHLQTHEIMTVVGSLKRLGEGQIEKSERKGLGAKRDPIQKILINSSFQIS